jgi:signal transduction histidine kinase
VAGRPSPVKRRDARDLVEAHGGTVGDEITVGLGTSIQVSLPV